MGLVRKDGELTKDKPMDSRYEGWWLSPGIGVLVCRRCGALIDPDYIESHNQHHAKGA